MNTKVKMQDVPNHINSHGHDRLSQLNSEYSQSGLGLIEVLVALLLLAVAALGYSALQANSLSKTDDSLSRTQSINLIHTAVEMIRVNAIDLSYNQYVNNPNDQNSTKLKDNVLSSYEKKLNRIEPLGTAVDCHTVTCTQEQLVVYDVAQLFKRAESIGVTLGMVTCPGTDVTGAAKTHCLIAAWKDTTATMGSGSTACMKNDGTYYLKADCVYMEAY